MKIVHSCRALFPEGHLLEHVNCGVEYAVTEYYTAYGYVIHDNTGKRVLISWSCFSKHFFKQVS